MKEVNKDLENFLNAQLGENEIPFEEADWSAMEEKLDAFDSMTGKSGLSWQKYMILGLAAVLLFLAGWYAREAFTTAEPLLAESEATIELTDGNGVVQEELPDKDKSDNLHAIDGERTEQPDNAMAEETSAHSQEQVEFNNSSNNIGAENSNQNAASSQATGSNRLADQQNTQEQANQSAAGSSRANQATADLADETTDGFSGKEITKPALNQDQLLPLTRRTDWYRSALPQFDMVPVPGEYSVLSVTDEGISKDEENTKNRSKWAIGLTVAPDLNGVGQASNYRLAWELGASVYYSFNAKWRVTSGIYYAKKAYQANGSDYNPPEGYWDYISGGYVPETVDAECGILDIPLNISYIWNPDSKIRFTTTTGLSNYILLNEDYQYTYRYMTPDYDGWSTDENSSAFFGMLNLGMGAEWRLSPGLDFIAEPYFKIPLKEIGYGNVSLTGAGIYFTIRKQLNSK